MWGETFGEAAEWWSRKEIVELQSWYLTWEPRGELIVDKNIILFYSNLF
jgi:hypothetical protein